MTSATTPLPQRATLIAGLQQTPADLALLQAFTQRCEADAAWQDLQQTLRQCLPHLPQGSELEALANYYCGKACVELNQFEQGLPHLERCIALQPSFAYSHQLLGRCQRALNRFDEALESFRRTTQLMSSFPWAWFDLGEILLERQDSCAAIDALQQALRVGESTLSEQEQSVIQSALDRARQAAADAETQRLMQQLFPGVKHLTPLQSLELSLAMLEQLASQSAA